MSVMDFMRYSFVSDKDQLIHLSGSLINYSTKITLTLLNVFLQSFVVSWLKYIFTI
jgi:hypothetical protein